MEGKIIIPNPSRLEEAKRKIASAGLDNFQVMSDFDGTLTAKFIDGQRASSFLNILKEEPIFPSSRRDEASRLYNFYHPIEIDPEVPLAEKKEKMKEWWEKSFELLIGAGLKKSWIEEVASSPKMRLREGFGEMMSRLDEKKVPLTIVSSSGLGVDSISMLLEKRGKLLNNIGIISNVIEWDSDGQAVAVRQPIIHGMNKDEISFGDFSCFAKARGRRNIMVLGDMVGDVGMIKNIDHENAIRIGFLEENIRENISCYQEYYDAIIAGASSAEYVNRTIMDIFGSF